VLPCALQLQTGGARLVGDGDNDAVLCTADKTYEVKKVETSNAVCMVPPVPHGAPLPLQFCIEAIKDDFFELRLIPARLDRLKALLKSSEYRGRDGEGLLPAGVLLTRRQLEDRVQASAAELDLALAALGAIDFNGYVRVLSVDIIKDSVKQLLDVILECGWKLSSISMAKCRQHLSDVDPLLLSQALGWLGHRVYGSSSSSSSSDEWELDERKVASWSAEIIMSHGVKEENKKTVRMVYDLMFKYCNNY
jgi:sister chromatid cohesion protein DCC1